VKADDDELMHIAHDGGRAQHIRFSA
jgi:hypothetical protein